jgi:23S rRNA (cytosine1962-C5)-methyltransferase
MLYPTLQLKKNEDRRIRAGHLWIYSNEINTAITPLTQFTPGQLVNVFDHQNKAIGTAYINPHSLISARLLHREINIIIDETFFIQRLTTALLLREWLFNKPYYRLAYGDSDNLPGLIIDRFNDILVTQINTAGMELLLPYVEQALVKLLKPTAILLRNDSPARILENLTTYTKPLYGEPPTQIMLEENQVKFQTNIWEGQKTGWFYDHRMNRANMIKYVQGKRILDVFCYAGAWAIQAAVAGAKEVLVIDSSAPALSQLENNAKLNNVSDKIKIIHDDAFKALANLKNSKEQFDVIILDPPAFIKRKKDLKEGLTAYRRINDLALQLLSPDSILISASCSQHLDQQALTDILRNTSMHRNKTLQIIEQGHQGPDHPIHPAIPETAYLKAIFARVC